MRIFFCTWPKTGSQWFRDLLCNELSAPRVGWAHRRHENPEFDVATGRWPAIEGEGLFFGPIYRMEPGFVASRVRPEDRVLAVLRDPRDMAVSWMHSTAYSHRPGAPKVDLQRPVLRALPLRLRVRQALDRTFISSRGMAPWTVVDDERFLVLRYEELVEDTAGSVARAFAFAGSPLPGSLVREVVAACSFARRSGRERGCENTMSHHRKGIVGDWRNYVDRELGGLLESAYPGFLCRLGYEEKETWWVTLPLETPALSAEDGADLASGEIRRLTALAEEMERRSRDLQQVADDRLRVIDGLKQVADDRLRAIEGLKQASDDQQGVIGELKQAADDRLRVIEELKQAADDRLDVIRKLQGKRPDA